MLHTPSLPPPTKMMSLVSRSSRLKHWPYKRNGRGGGWHMNTHVMRR
ncbi:hypothetical protein LINGRAHAP2_LOCUS29211 [Linum grandiflorum]